MNKDIFIDKRKLVVNKHNECKRLLFAVSEMATVEDVIMLKLIINELSRQRKILNFMICNYDFINSLVNPII